MEDKLDRLNSEESKQDQQTAVDRFVSNIGTGLSWLVFIAMIISVYEVISRYAFNQPTTWVHETTIALAAAIFTLGGPYALARNKHIQIVWLFSKLKGRSYKALTYFSLLASLLFTTLLAYATYIIAYKATHSPSGDWRLETSGSSWDSFSPAVIKVVLFLSAVIMTVQLVAKIYQKIKCSKEQQ